MRNHAGNSSTYLFYSPHELANGHQHYRLQKHSILIGTSSPPSSTTTSHTAFHVTPTLRRALDSYAGDSDNCFNDPVVKNAFKHVSGQHFELSANAVGSRTCGRLPSTYKPVIFDAQKRVV